MGKRQKPFAMANGICYHVRMDAYQKLLKHFGTIAAVSRHFNRHRETVRLWKFNGLPPELALDIEQATDGKVTIREVLESKQ